MTIVIGMMGEDFSMIAVDSRLSDVNSVGEIVSYSDKYSKLHDIRFGWLATTGSMEISEGFAKRVADNNINNIDDIQIVFNQNNEEVRAKYNGDFKSVFDNTLTLFSYSYKEGDLVKFNLEFISSNFERLGISGNNKIAILPLNISNEMKELEKKFTPLIEQSNNLTELIYHTSDYIEEVSKINQTVSDTCNFGFMFNNIDVLVTRKYLRGRAKDIKESCLNGNIEIYLQERTPIMWNLDI